MLRSMYSGISGLRGFQTKLDVIGNNIANVNTYGFKKGRVTFSDLMSQNLKGATGAVQNANGGTNPQQVGLGIQISTIDTIATPGSRQPTGRELDLSIDGEGYFILEDPSATGSRFYTRAGNFYFDVDPNDTTGKTRRIVNADGLPLLGFPNGQSNLGHLTIPVDAQSFSIGSNGEVHYVDNAGKLQTAGTIRLATFPNAEGLEKVGGNLLRESPNSGQAEPTGVAPGTGGSGSVVSASLEMSNVDLSEEMTEMIVAQRGFQANTRIITTSDEILQELVNLKR